uniref:Uncharacterized protein n=1 Tax=Romanomermis culicivorax TaxID=13658 RepID=A0A915HNF3_ROMCU
MEREKRKKKNKKKAGKNKKKKSKTKPKNKRGKKKGKKRKATKHIRIRGEDAKKQGEKEKILRIQKKKNELRIGTYYLEKEQLNFLIWFEKQPLSISNLGSLIKQLHNAFLVIVDIAVVLVFCKTVWMEHPATNLDLHLIKELSISNLGSLIKQLHNVFLVIVDIAVVLVFCKTVWMEHPAINLDLHLIKEVNIVTRHSVATLQKRLDPENNFGHLFACHNFVTRCQNRFTKRSRLITKLSKTPAGAFLWRIRKLKRTLMNAYQEITADNLLLIIIT